MANLLPQNTKKKVYREYTLRAMIIALIAVASVGVVASVLLVPTYVLLDSKLEGLNIAYRSDTDEQKDTDEDYKTSISRIEARLAVVQQDTDTKKIPYEIMARLFEIKPDTITLSKISYARASNKLMVKGSADTRKELDRFIKRIGQEDMFVPLESYPYENLSVKKDVPFDFSIQLREQQ
ncbi:MAG: hypothetical protein KAR24_00220 [Candidatus Pacebacteria bacterium]|nr:hypothetical protein [Candidatus Paceibacterota bacterium]